MNQRETDMFFWDQVADDWAELAAKPIILSQASNHPSVRGAIVMLANRGYISQGVMEFVQRRLAKEWQLDICEVDQLIDMQIAADIQQESTK